MLTKCALVLEMTISMHLLASPTQKQMHFGYSLNGHEMHFGARNDHLNAFACQSGSETKGPQQHFHLCRQTQNLSKPVMKKIKKSQKFSKVLKKFSKCLKSYQIARFRLEKIKISQKFSKVLKKFSKVIKYTSKCLKNTTQWCIRVMPMAQNWMPHPL